MNRRSLLAPLLLAMACDARTTEEPDAKSAEREVRASEDIPAEPAMAEPTPTRDLGQLERELADNEVKLRELGVLIAGTTVDGDGEAESPKPSPKPATKAGRGTKTKQPKQDKQGKDEGKAEDSIAGTAPGSGSNAGGKAVSGGGDGLPDPAKSIQSPPRPNEQAEERCPLICSLADNTCELNDEICELAERHTDDDAYSVACERASDDCQQAREACLECVG